MKSLEAKEKQLTPDQQRKHYQKPTWMRQEMFERFALACTKLSLAACGITAKNS